MPKCSLIYILLCFELHIGSSFYNMSLQMRTTHVTDNGEVETTQWDAPPIITDERCQFKITNDMNRALTHNHLPHDDEITKEEVQQHAAVNDCFINIPSDVKGEQLLILRLWYYGTFY